MLLVTSSAVHDSHSFLALRNGGIIDEVVSVLGEGCVHCDEV